MIAANPDRSSSSAPGKMPEIGGKEDLNITSALREPTDDGFVKEDVISNTVPAKYHGTRADQQDMIVLGKKQVLRVRVA